jgi:hypothetical protein
MLVKPSDLKSVFEELRGPLEAYSPLLVSKMNEAQRFALWSEKDVMIEGR